MSEKKLYLALSEAGDEVLLVSKNTPTRKNRRPRFRVWPFWGTRSLGTWKADLVIPLPLGTIEGIIGIPMKWTAEPIELFPPACIDRKEEPDSILKKTFLEYLDKRIQESDDPTEPYLVTRGKSYSLVDLRREVDLETLVGKKQLSRIVIFAISCMERDKK